MQAELKSGVIHGYVAFDEATRDKLVAEGKKVIHVLFDDSADIFRKSPAEEKYVIFADRRSGNHHNQLWQEHEGVHCVMPYDVKHFEFDRLNGEIRGQFANGEGVVKNGDPITIEYRKYLVKIPGGLPSLSAFNQISTGHIGEERVVQNELEPDHNLKPEVSCNAYEARCIPEIAYSNVSSIGLLRTETGIAGFGSNSDKGREALKKVYLTKGREGLPDLHEIQYESMARILSGISKNEGIRSINIRLLDKPAKELFRRDDFSELEKAYDGDVPRGAALAEEVKGLYATQMDAIFKAIADSDVDPSKVRIGIMVPNVDNAEQVARVKGQLDQVVQKHMPDAPIEFGAMLETTAACDAAAEIAQQCDFVSFGTNDLSAEIHEYSRMEENGFAAEWQGRNYHPINFISPEVENMIVDTVGRIKEASPDTHISICGDQLSTDHGMAGSLTMAYDLGIDSVSVRSKPDIVQSARMMLHELGAQQQSLANRNQIVAQQELNVSRPFYIQELFDKFPERVEAVVTERLDKDGVKVTGRVDAGSHPEIIGSFEKAWAKTEDIAGAENVTKPIILIAEDSIYPVFYAGDYNAIVITKAALDEFSGEAIAGAFGHELGELVQFELGKDNLPSGFSHDNRESFADEFGATVTSKQAVLAALNELEQSCGMAALTDDEKEKIRSELRVKKGASDEEIEAAIYESIGKEYLPYGQRVEAMESYEPMGDHEISVIKKRRDEGSGMHRGGKSTKPESRNGDWADS